MKRIRLRLIILCAVLGILNACAKSGVGSPIVPHPEPTTVQATPQIRASDKMFYWIEEARELQTMARQREREAELVLKKTPGPSTYEFVKQMRLFAHQLHEAAEYAEAQAKSAEQEISSDITQQLPLAVR